MSNCVVRSGGLRLPCSIIAKHSVEGWLGSRLRTASAWLPAASADAHHGDGAAGDQPVLKPSVLFIAKILHPQCLTARRERRRGLRNKSFSRARVTTGHARLRR